MCASSFQKWRKKIVWYSNPIRHQHQYNNSLNTQKCFAVPHNLQLKSSRLHWRTIYIQYEWQSVSSRFVVTFFSVCLFVFRRLWNQCRRRANENWIIVAWASLSFASRVLEAGDTCTLNNVYMLRNRTDQELEFVIVIIFSFGIYINPFECPLSLSLSISSTFNAMCEYVTMLRINCRFCTMNFKPKKNVWHTMDRVNVNEPLLYV